MHKNMGYLEKRCWREAIAMYVSEIEGDTESEDSFLLTWEALVEASETGKRPDVAFWRPFEQWEVDDVMVQIEHTACSLIMMVKDILKAPL